MNDWGFGFQQGQGRNSFLMSTASRPALGITLPLIQWVPGALSPGIKLPMREANHSFPSNAEVKNAWVLYFHSSICLHSVELT